MAELVAIGSSTSRATYHIVFVAVGFADEDLGRFVGRVTGLYDALRSDRNGIVGRRPERFDFSRATRPLRSRDATWPCIAVDDSKIHRLSVPSDPLRAIAKDMDRRTIVIGVIDGTVARTPIAPRSSPPAR